MLVICCLLDRSRPDVEGSGPPFSRFPGFSAGPSTTPLGQVRHTGGIIPRPTPRTPTSAAELERRRRDAIELNDDVVQGLVVARMALEVGDLDTATTTIDRTLDAARKIVGQLLRAGGPAIAGDLVRHHPVDEQEAQG